MIVDIPSVQPQTPIHLSGTVPSLPPATFVRIDDAATRTLATHPHLNRRSVQCTRDQGKLILEGTVTSYFEKQMAQEALRQLAGDEPIDNRISVDW